MLPSHVLRDVMDILQISHAHMELIHWSNDRLNIYLTMKRIQHPLTSYRDLEFLIPDGCQPGAQLPKFLVFFDSIDESLKAAAVLQKKLPLEYCDRVVWFNSNNTHKFREESTAAFQEGSLYGLACTDLFGMVRCPIPFHLWSRMN